MHELLLIYHYHTRRTPQHFDGHSPFLMRAVGIAVASFALALPLTLLIELPPIALERLLLKKRVRHYCYRQRRARRAASTPPSTLPISLNSGDVHRATPASPPPVQPYDLPVVSARVYAQHWLANPDEPLSHAATSTMHSIDVDDDVCAVDAVEAGHNDDNNCVEHICLTAQSSTDNTTATSHNFVDSTDNDDAKESASTHSNFSTASADTRISELSSAIGSANIDMINCDDFIRAPSLTIAQERDDAFTEYRL